MLLGIDVGTSALKAVVIDERGLVVSSASVPYEVDRPREGWTEQPPSRWWKAAVEGIRQVRAGGEQKAPPIPADHIRAIGLSGQMHGAVFLDQPAIAGARDGPIEAIRPALLWNDQRTAKQCAEIEQAMGGPEAIVQIVGNRALTGFTLPKLLWLREHEPAHFQSVRALVNPKDFLRLQLTGTLGTDPGDAAGILLLDIQTRTWSAGACHRVGVDPALLPPIDESAVVVGELTPWAAGRTGLRPGTPVVAGTGDNAAGAIGAGVVVPGLVLATLGTSGVMYAHSDHPRTDLTPGRPPGRTQTMCAADGSWGHAGHWCVTGCMLAAAGALHWARDTIAPGIPFDTLLAEAATAPPGYSGLIFLPYLNAERCPYPDPFARGAWFGLRAQHTRAHLVRAVLEGVTFGMAQMLDLIRGLDIPVSTIRLGGGGNKSDLWRQMQADVYGLPCAMLNSDEGPAYGVALLAGVGVGVWPSVADACRATIRQVHVHEPDPASSERYRASRAVYERLYNDLAPAMHALSTAAT